MPPIDHTPASPPRPRVDGSPMTARDAAEAAAVRLLVLDCDGVLTDGGIRITDSGEEFKVFHVRDGFAMKAWKRLGGEIAIVTGRTSRALGHRARELAVDLVIEGCADKGRALDELGRRTGIAAAATAALGDDLPDLPMLRAAHYPMAVADAAAEVRAVAKYITCQPGGHGAVREAIEHLLRARGAWPDVVTGTLHDQVPT